MDTFDKDNYYNKSDDGEFLEIVLEDGTVIEQMTDFDDCFVEHTYLPESLFYKFKKFSNNGKLIQEGELFIKGDFEKGIWYTYDEFGVVISQINKDEDYDFSFDKLMAMMLEANVDINHARTRVIKKFIDNFPYWEVSWYHGQSLGKKSILKNIRLNGKTGKAEI